MKHPYWGIILTIIIFYIVSWLITCGIIKLITLCFGMDFKLLVATGIWLIFILIAGFFGGKSK